MESISSRPSVQRVREALERAGLSAEILVLDETSRTAAEAASALGIAVGQIAASIVFRLPDDRPLLFITSGRHRVNVEVVARQLGLATLHRADADYVKTWSGFSIGGVAPIGWVTTPGITLIDEALSEYEIVWAASGHPHAVYSTTYAELIACTGASPMIVGD